LIVVGRTEQHREKRPPGRKRSLRSPYSIDQKYEYDTTDGKAVAITKVTARDLVIAKPCFPIKIGSQIARRSTRHKQKISLRRFHSYLPT
jgi:hypothetical protein